MFVATAIEPATLLVSAQMRPMIVPTTSTAIMAPSQYRIRRRVMTPSLLRSSDFANWRVRECGVLEHLVVRRRIARDVLRGVLVRPADLVRTSLIAKTDPYRWSALLAGRRAISRSERVSLSRSAPRPFIR